MFEREGGENGGSGENGIKLPNMVGKALRGKGE